MESSGVAASTEYYGKVADIAQEASHDAYIVALEGGDISKKDLEEETLHLDDEEINDLVFK